MKNIDGVYEFYNNGSEINCLENGQKPISEKHNRPIEHRFIIASYNRFSAQRNIEVLL